MGIEGTYLNITKVTYDKPTATSYSVVKADSISSKIRKKTRTSTLTTFIQHSFGNASHSNLRRKRNKRNLSWKRRSQTVTVPDYMIIYIENPKDVTKRLQELINELGKVAGYKINAKKCVALTSTATMENSVEIS